MGDIEIYKRVVDELLTTERQYVKSLEQLEMYKEKILKMKLLSQSEVDKLFLNVDELALFHRKFLKLADDMASLDVTLQRWDQFFDQVSPDFFCYRQFCERYRWISAYAEHLAPRLMPLQHVMDPKYELQSSLQRPVGRCAKYPLIAHMLAEACPPTWPHYNQLRSAVETLHDINLALADCSRVASLDMDHHNLLGRVQEWKNVKPSELGDLLERATLQVERNGSMHSYDAYLYSRALLCFKRYPTHSTRGSTWDTPDVFSKEPIQVKLRGRVFIETILSVEPDSKDGKILYIWYQNDRSIDERVSMTFTSEFERQRWQESISKAMKHYQDQTLASPLSSLSLEDPFSDCQNINNADWMLSRL